MKKRFSGPQIVAKLRQADVLIGQGKNVPEVCKEIEISVTPNISIFSVSITNLFNHRFASFSLIILDAD